MLSTSNRKQHCTVDSRGKNCTCFAPLPFSFIGSSVASLPATGGMAKQPDAVVRSLRRTSVLAVLLGCCFCRTFVLPLRNFGAGLSAAGSGARTRADRMARAAEADDVAAPAQVRIGLIHCPDGIMEFNKDWKTTFMALNFTNETYFQTEVPDSFQLPLASKLLAMSNTVDVIVAVYSVTTQETLPEILRGFQTVALTTNVPIVPTREVQAEGMKTIADRAIQMAEIRQQALMGGGPRRSIFFGIGANKTAGDSKQRKVYF
eukprot:symbB.v1.2.005604.t1/scaffold324.1/size254390/1